MSLNKRKFTVLGLLVSLALSSASAQIQRRNLEEPEWLQEAYVRETWPEEAFLHNLDNFETRGLDDEEKHLKFLRFEEDMKAELARNILVQVKSSSTSQTSQVDSWGSTEGANQVGTSSFEAQQEINVEAEFSALTRTFEKNKTYHVLVIVDKAETAEKLVLKTSLLLDQYNESAKVALQRKRALNLPELDEGLESSNRRLATAIWLDVHVDDLDEYRKTKDAAAELAGFINELKLLKSEQEFREIQGDIVTLIQESNFSDALDKLERLERAYGGREELTELKTSARLSYQQHVKSQCPMLSESECLQLFEAYMKFFPGDEIMQRELTSKRQRWFDSKIEAIHLYIDNEELLEARQLWEEVQAETGSNVPSSTKRVQERLRKAEQEAFLENLKREAESDPFAAWRKLERKLAVDKMLIAVPGIQSLRKDIGRTCKKAEIREAKRANPFGWTLSFESSFRSNGYVVNDQFSTAGVKLYGGIRGYALGAFRRKVPPGKIDMAEGKRKKDHSRGYGLTGIILRYWDGSSFRAWDNSDDPSLLEETDEVVGIGFATARSNAFELELGVQNELSRIQSSSVFGGSDVYATAGLRIQLLKMARSRVYARGSWTLLSDLISAPRFHMDAGLGWTPMFGGRIENREAIVAKYR